MWGRKRLKPARKKKWHNLKILKKKIKIALLGYFKSGELKGAKYFHLNDET